MLFCSNYETKNLANMRIAHMGAVGPFDVITAVSALEAGLADKGYVFELGVGVGAAEEIIKEM